MTFRKKHSAYKLTHDGTLLTLLVECQEGHVI